MEIEDWASSSGGSSDSEVAAPDSDNEENCYAYGDLPKLQFRKDTSKACWKEQLGMAEIVSNKGRMWTTTGIARGGKIYIFLEDILFLAEIGALHLLDDEDKCIPLEDIYKKVAEGVGGSSWESFEVYRHLKSLGYIIKRHGVCWSMKRDKSVPACVEIESGSQRIINDGNDDFTSITETMELFRAMQINELRPVFDVYLPNSKFRKSNPGNPIFVLCISTGNPPTKRQIEDLEGKCEGIPVKFCYVEHGRLHTKKRNRLAQERLNDMVYVKFNRALQRQYKKEGSGDPIILEDIDESNEWLMGRMDNDDGDEDDDLVFLDGDLTWSDVSRASGAYETPHFTRTSRGRVNDDGSGPSKTRSAKGKGLALQDEDDEVEVEADLGEFDSDEGDEPVLGFDDDDVGEY